MRRSVIRGRRARVAAPGRTGAHADPQAELVVLCGRQSWTSRHRGGRGLAGAWPRVVIMGAGGNVTVQVGEQGILLVDTGIASMSEKVWAAVQKIAPPRKPLRYVINTTENAEHTGGNAVIAAKGETVPLREANYTAGPQGSINYKRASVVSIRTCSTGCPRPPGKNLDAP